MARFRTCAALTHSRDDRESPAKTAPVRPYNRSMNDKEQRVEAAKRQVWRDIIMKRYSQTQEDTEKWAANFDRDLEEYVQARIAAAKGE